MKEEIICQKITEDHSLPIVPLLSTVFICQFEGSGNAQKLLSYKVMPDLPF